MNEIVHSTNKTPKYIVNTIQEELKYQRVLKKESCRWYKEFRDRRVWLPIWDTIKIPWPYVPYYLLNHFPLYGAGYNRYTKYSQHPQMEKEVERRAKVAKIKTIVHTSRSCLINKTISWGEVFSYHTLKTSLFLIYFNQILNSAINVKKQ